MRWGVRDEATDEHLTTELCMREIRNCQRLSMGPNFVVSRDIFGAIRILFNVIRPFQSFLRNINISIFVQFFGGQKYGYRPIPTVILGSEFLLIREALQSMNIDTVLLDTWYKIDTNAVPFVYILQWISTILVNFNNKVR